MMTKPRQRAINSTKQTNGNPPCENHQSNGNTPSESHSNGATPTDHHGNGKTPKDSHTNGEVPHHHDNDNVAPVEHHDSSTSEILHHYLDPAQQAIAALPHKAYDKVEEIALRVWTLMHHHQLPNWLKDNEFLVKGHRPELNSFIECFKSIFRIHTETGNIWTHLLGFFAFVGIAVYYLLSEEIKMSFAEKLSFFMFFLGAISCLGFSWLFHTVYCHSENVGRLFCKLDYCGIALLTMGSFVPWLHYSFYCRLCTKITYLICMLVLGSTCIYVSMSDQFAQPKFRALRAAMYIGLGFSGVIPVVHYVITDGFANAINFAALGQLSIMALLYLSGAIIYACRFPERIWPGKFDIWFQSHQIFHVFVIAAAFVHYHGISEIASHRLNLLDCIDA